jgi:hypothetical protein
MAVAAPVLDSLSRGTKDRVTGTSLLSDELVRRLIGVGQVDIVVGVPTLNHAETITATLDVIDQGLMRYFPRARTVVIGADGGSSDGTVEIVANGTGAAVAARASGLRTRHRIGASYRGIPGRASAIRLIFTATDLLQAQAVVICDPDDAGLASEWIGALLQPVITQSIDVVAGAHRRHPLEGLLVTQLIRPLMRAVYGRHFDQPLLGAFACSRRFAAGCLSHDVWDRSPIREAIEVWLAGTAMTGVYQAGQVALGRFQASRRPGPGLQAVFPPVVGALFDTLDQHAGIWIAHDRAALGPVIGLDGTPPADLVAPALDSSGLGAAFQQDVRDLRPVLEDILAPDTFAALSTIADASKGVVEYDDDSWVATVCDFVAAHHRGVMDRTHIVQALMPLYLGRVASFIGEQAESSITDIEQRLERLSRQFEDRRQYLIDRWHRTT